MQPSPVQVDKKDLTSSDPYLKMARVLESGEFIYVFKTEVQSRTLNPEWRTIQVQWIPRFKSRQYKSIRDLGAVRSACPAILKRIPGTVPTTDKSSAWHRAPVWACHGVS